MAVGDEVPTWEQVARDYGRFIYTVAYRLTGDRPDADDLVQEVMVRVRRGLLTYQPGSMTGWLARITTNAFYDDVRYRRRRRTEAWLEHPDEVAADAPPADESVDLPGYLQAALADLAVDFRVAVVLCDVVGMSYAEISEITDVPVGTVRSRIHRGRSQLRDRLVASGELAP